MGARRQPHQKFRLVQRSVREGKPLWRQWTHLRAGIPFSCGETSWHSELQSSTGAALRRVGKRGGSCSICSDTTGRYSTSGPASPVGPRDPGSPLGPGSPWKGNKEGLSVFLSQLMVQLLLLGVPPDPLIRHSPAKHAHQPAAAVLGDRGHFWDVAALVR